MKTHLFTRRRYHDNAIDYDIDQFIKDRNIEVIDIKFAIAFNSDGAITGESALLMYEDKPEEEVKENV